MEMKNGFNFFINDNTFKCCVDLKISHVDFICKFHKVYHLALKLFYTLSSEI